jgi:glycosyltransferase involved in cell wall biosynthesis
MIYADVTRLLYRHLTNIAHTGIDKVNLEYAKWLRSRGGGFCAKRKNDLKDLPLGTWERLLAGEVRPGSDGNPWMRRALVFLRWIAVGRSVPEGATILVSTHSWLANAGTWAKARARRWKAVVFIHDLIPVEFPEYQRPGEKAYHETRMELTLRNASALVVNSRCTESAVRRFAARKGIEVPPLLVNPLGHDAPAEDAVRNLLPDERPYFLTLGTIEPRKNHLLLLSLWRHLATRHGGETPRLVVVGRRGWECEQVVDMLERCEAIHPHVLEINDASDAEVLQLIRGAKALLLPSFAEGFGMPVQEALHEGVPVICSPLPAIREFAGDIPDYAEPHDGARWLELIEQHAVADSPVRSAQLARIPGFRTTTWDDHFIVLEDFLRGLGAFDNQPSASAKE